MTFAILAAVLFACSAIFSQQATRIFGSLGANFYRLCGACAILGLITLVSFPDSVHPELFGWFFLSGIVGFGLGDICMFLAYPRLGSRLCLLIHFAGSTITGALGDWVFIGKGLQWTEAAAALLILSGLAITLLSQPAGRRSGSLTAGIIFALLSAVGMGTGTALSHLAYDKSVEMGMLVPGISQAWQRSTAGVLMGGIVFLAVTLAMKRMAVGKPVLPVTPTKKPRKGCSSAFWLGGTMIFGPVIGVSCYQIAIMKTESSAIVLAVAATSTLIIMPLARLIEKDKPGLRQVMGTLVAVSGVAWLCWLRR